MNINDNIISLLETIGPGYMSSNAYDTAWVARLTQYAPDLANGALNWLRNNQLEDGTWGTAQPAYYHDRIVCTLAAMIALAENGDMQDRKRISRAQDSLQMVIQPLANKGMIETIAAELLIPALLKQAEDLNLIKRWDDTELDRLDKLRQEKLSMIPDRSISRYITLAFTSEFAGQDAYQILDTDNLQEVNGSVANSPAATAYYALQIKPGDTAALNYLRHWSKADGGIQNAAPFDIFEITWTLWNLHVSGQLNPHIMDKITPHLNFLKQSWSPKDGVGFASNYRAKDGDETGMAYEVLRRYDQEISPQPLFKYECDDYFRCFDLEVNPSISTNIHILGALRYAGLAPSHPSVQKIVRFLWNSQYWFDKWHVSPYYPTAHAIIIGTGYVDEVIEDAVQWLLDSQNEDGSWGYFSPTAEETAYAIQALSTWNRKHHTVPIQVLSSGIEWLKAHFYKPYQSLWIGKCLYTPELVVQSTILSAIKMVEEDVQLTI